MSQTVVTRSPIAEASVHQRYSSAAQTVEPALCCPVEYDSRYLDAIPQEIIERDYGCGDPTPYVKPGDTVLDLGSGAGKLCYIAAQVVGRTGRVIGVDCNREMLALARRHAPAVAERLGFDSVDFRYGMIQDLTLDLARLETVLADRPVASSSDYLQLRNIEEQLRHDHPLIASNSIDCVISNCVLNLVRQQDRQRLFAEIFRVLRSGGRAAISDIVADETVPDEMRQDPELWSGCVSGAFREDEFLTAFEDAGFHGIEIVKRAQQPWQTIQGIEFRSVTVLAYKGKQGPCFERNQAVVYRGPFRSVEDDDGHVYRRGERIAVCDKTFQLLAREPYTGAFEAIEPHVDVPPADAQRFDCTRSRLRDARETKGQDYRFTSVNPAACCGGDQGCC